MPPLMKLFETLLFEILDPPRIQVLSRVDNLTELDIFHGLLNLIKHDQVPIVNIIKMWH